MDILETIRREIERSPQSRAEISRKTGISEAQLHRIVKKGQSVYCETASQLLQHFGYTLTKKQKKGRAKK